MSIGKIIKETRENKGMTREQLAKKLKITPLYLGHIERDDLVRISIRVVDGLKKSLGPSVKKIEPMTDQHNELVRIWRRRIERRRLKAA